MSTRASQTTGERTGVSAPTEFDCRIMARLAPLIAAWLFSFACGTDAPKQAEAPPPAEAAPPVNPEPASPWKPLANDHIHDPENEALPYLQEPEEALSLLPRAESGGNNVNWVAALRSGAITPRAKISESFEVRVLDLDVVMPDTAGMPAVVFPHKTHTEWLDCSNCHDRIFKAKAGANKFGMFDILQGNYCGQCHGAVSFPLTQCLRCHSKDQK